MCATLMNTSQHIATFTCVLVIMHVNVDNDTNLFLLPLNAQAQQYVENFA